MEEDRECKIVQDLLPNYIENLTDEVTNEYIDEHIKKCKNCEEILNNMKADINTDKIISNKKIDALKKVKRRYKSITLGTIIIIFFIMTICFYIKQNYIFYLDDNNKLVIERVTFDSKNYSNKTYVIIKTKKQEKGTIDGYSYLNIILTVDENNKCTNLRKSIYGYTKQTIEQKKEILNQNDSTIPFSNWKEDKGTIYYNDSSYNGKTKEEIIKIFEETTLVDSIEEF